MPKHVSPITIKDRDVIFLKSIVSGRITAGEDIVKRAKVLLLLSEGKQIKVAAKEIGMRENSVTEIRRRFLANGIDSLRDKSRSGRPTTKLPAEEVEAKVRDVISSSYAKGTPVPSVRELAGELNASEKNVREALKKSGLIQERKHLWEFTAAEAPEAKAIELAGIYLSPDQQMIFVRVLNTGTYNSSGTSVVSTKSSALADALSASKMDDGSVDLADALDIFTSGSEARRTGKSDALAFVKALHADFQADGSQDEFHLFVNGTPLAESSRSLLPGVHVHAEPDGRTWLLQAENLFSMLGDARSDLCQRLSAGIRAYMQRSNVDKAVFQWKKDRCLPETGQVRGGNSPAGSSEAKPAGTIEFEARIMADDGTWISYTAKGVSPVKQEDFNMSSANAYLNSFDAVEQAIVSVSHDAARGINEAYAKDLVKKTAHVNRIR